MFWISSHTLLHTCRRIHTLSEIGTYELKKKKEAVQSEKDLSLHSISVTEVLERPFSSDRTLIETLSYLLWKATSVSVT